MSGAKKILFGGIILVALLFGFFQNCADSFNQAGYDQSSSCPPNADGTPGTCATGISTKTAANPCGITGPEIQACVPATMAPKIIYQTPNQALEVGQPLALRLGVFSTATGSAYGYSWTKNGVKLPNTQATFNVTKVTAGTAGTYNVTVNNQYGTDEASFTVTVQPARASGEAIIVTPPQSANIINFSDLNTTVYYPTAVNLTVVATGAKLHYQWYYTPNGLNAIETAIPKATSSTLLVTPPTFTSGTYRVLVSNDIGNVPYQVSASAIVQILSLTY